jgi:metallo-beta-lactamase family protein
MHLVEAGGLRLLLDCGIVQGGARDSIRDRRGVFPFDPASLDALLLSHAHVDHCGNVPALVRQGFAGPIFCCPATRSLMGVMLADTARIQEENAHVDTLVGSSGQAPGPVFTRADVSRTIARCITLPYDEPHLLGNTVEVRFVDAGHILGSAMVHLAISDPSGSYRITFSGDLGRRGLPFLRDVAAVPDCDLLICESTYGGRRHDTIDQMADKLGAVLTRTAERGGKILIPAFSLGRTQLVVFYLRRWMALGRLPRLPIFVDSPLASAIGDVYDQHPEGFQLAATPDDPPTSFIGSGEESHDLSQRKDPCVVVASGGMCEGGRIIQHLRHHIDDPRTSVVLVSYQAPHSLGARLLEHRPTVRFHGRTWNKWAEVLELNGFSGHADHDDLTSYLDPLIGQTKQVQLVHGELHAAQALATSLRNHGFDDVGIPARDQTVSLA